MCKGPWLCGCYGQVRKLRRVNSDLPALLDEWASSLFRELDYQREAANGKQFADLYGQLEVSFACESCTKIKRAMACVVFHHHPSSHMSSHLCYEQARAIYASHQLQLSPCFYLRSGQRDRPNAGFAPIGRLLSMLLPYVLCSSEPTGSSTCSMVSSKAWLAIGNGIVWLRREYLCQV